MYKKFQTCLENKKALDVKKCLNCQFAKTHKVDFNELLEYIITH